LAAICSNIHRIDAVLEPMCGHLGWGKSHVKAIEMAIANNWNSVLIVEDDLELTQSPDILCKMITDAYAIRWDVVLLGLGHHHISPSEYSFLNKVEASTCTHGYLIRKEYYPTLLENFRGAVVKMTKEYEEHQRKCIEKGEPITKLNYCSAIDQEWRSLQKKNTFYVFKPEIGKQRDGIYSDNNCSFETQKRKIRETQESI
jgi:GR25 family glycosyltransferase involved in LPS biosynthesis